MGSDGTRPHRLPHPQNYVFDGEETSKTPLGSLVRLGRAADKPVEALTARPSGDRTGSVLWHRRGGLRGAPRSLPRAPPNMQGDLLPKPHGLKCIVRVDEVVRPARYDVPRG